jgi:hypothetical protein
LINRRCWDSIILTKPITSKAGSNTLELVEAYPGDTASSVPDHGNKAGHMNFLASHCI